jgi:hypothetical protein
METTMRYFLRLLAFALLASVLPAVNTQASGKDDLDKKTVEIVKQAGDLIKNAKSFHAEAVIQTDLEAGGKKQHMSVSGAYDIVRPKQFSFRTHHPDSKGAGVDIVSDGKTLFVSAPRLKQYTQEEAPSDVTEIGNSLGRYGLPNVGLLFRNIVTEDPHETLMSGVTSCSLVGDEDIDGTPAHHLKFSQPEFEWELWVAAQGKPCILKMTSTASNDEVKRTIVETYKNWKIDEPIDQTAFAFTPPKDAKKVDSIDPEPQSNKEDK